MKSGFNGYIYKMLLYSRLSTEEGEKDSKSKRTGEPAVRLCLLVKSKATHVNSYQHDHPNGS